MKHTNCNQYKHNCRHIPVRYNSLISGFIKVPRVNVRVPSLKRPRRFIEVLLRRITITGVAIAFVYLGYLALIETLGTGHIVYESEAQIIDTTPEKIAELKLKTIHRLANECETAGVVEPDAAIVFDSNHQMSIGRYMWQIKSVQHWVKELYDRDISRKQAILIAVGEGDVNLDELTVRVMFDIEDGWKEWYNCSKRLGLDREVEIINGLQ